METLNWTAWTWSICGTGRKNFGFNVTGQDFAGIKTFQDFYDLVITRCRKPSKLSTWKGKTRGEHSDTYSLFT